MLSPSFFAKINEGDFYLEDMTLDELKNELLNRTFEDNIRIARHMVVCNAKRFLEKQFKDCEKWKKGLENCPSYDRLILFYEYVKNSEKP